jgi:Reverse transcriptase (RNA-dependent DNA polymerase)
MATDIQGAYLNAPCAEKVYTICGPEFGKYEGRVGVIVKALYGFKTSGYAWRIHLAATLRELNFDMCVADNDVWFRKALKTNKDEYYEYVLVYTNDILAISEKPLDILTCLDQHYILKPGSIGRPTQYLGAQVGQYRLPEEPEKI